MPLRTNAMSPGGFIRDHLMDAPGQRDYVGAMYRAYKLHLRDAGVAKLPLPPHLPRLHLDAQEDRGGGLRRRRGRLLWG